MYSQDGSLPWLGALRFDNGQRGVKRTAPSNSAERDENWRKLQNTNPCSAPWKLILDGAIKALGPHLYTTNEQTMPPLAKIKYERTFCWHNKQTGQMDQGMVFGVLGQRVYDERWRYMFHPTLSSSTGSKNEELWRRMTQELGHRSIVQTVSCGNDAARISRDLNAFLGPWVAFYEHHFGTG